MKSLVTGGARSGKSSFAERLCMSRAKVATYVATAQAFDAEMELRIAEHRRQREQTSFAWRTIEEPLQLPELLHRSELGSDESESPPPALLVDCLTLWLSNLVLANEEIAEQTARAGIAALEEAVRSYQGPLILVTNEVGNGIVPEYKLGRLYRDLSGVMNQRMAAICDEVFLVTAGIPVELKGLEYKW